MQNNVIIAGTLIVLIGAGLFSLVVPDVFGAAVVAVFLSAAFIVLIRFYSTEPEFLTKVFIVGLVVRLAFGFFIYLLDLREFFGGDATTYHFRGAILYDYLMGDVPADSNELLRATSMAGPGWGMTYLVGAIYYIFGKNFLAAQTFCGVVGAATAPLVHYCAEKIFQNRRVARFSAIAIAVFPSFIIWSSQLMKDGLIIFLLVLSISMVLKLQERFNYAALVLLVLSLGGIISLRFYIFYMIAVAVAGSFIVGLSNTSGSILRRAAALVLMGVALTYLGIIRTASSDLERYGDLERIQNSRLDQARSAESGYTEDVDVTTTAGAITALPIGFIYLVFAPFPWDVRNLRQAITLPEVFLWWAMIPFSVWGIWYSMKHRLRSTFPILIFSGMLTLVYSIFQSNVGTAYRQRTQIQVFLFLFIAVGWTLYQERKEDKRSMLEARRRRDLHGMPDGVSDLN